MSYFPSTNVNTALAEVKRDSSGNFSAGTITATLTGNASTVTTNANLTGVITSVGNATSIASQTGTGTKFVVDTSPALVTPNLGTPSALVLTNATSLPAASINNFTVNSYTPTIGDGTNNFTMTTQFGRYIQLGQLYFFIVDLSWSGKGSANGGVRISLPSAPTAGDRFPLIVGYASGLPTTAGAPQPMALAAPSSAYCDLYYEVAGTATQLGTSIIATSGVIYVSGWYY